MTADEAHRLADTNNYSTWSRGSQVGYVMYKITEEAKKGRYSAEIDKHIEADVLAELSILGYKCERTIRGTIILW